MIGKALALALVIGLFVSIGTVFLSLIMPVRSDNLQWFGWPSPFLKLSTQPNLGSIGLSYNYDILWTNFLIDWGVFSFIFFLLLIVLYKTNVLK